MTERGERVDLRRLADRRMTGDDDMRDQLDAGPELDVTSDDAVRADLDVLAEARAGVDDRRRVDFRH